jgi:hypothetical protein
MIQILFFIVSLVGTKGSASTTSAPQGVTYPVYSDVALNNIRIGAEGIVRASTDEDILVFIGNSASYFYHAVKNVRRSILVPSSNLYYLSEPRDYLEYKAEHYDLYSSVFLEPIRSEASTRGRNIVLVDYSFTGRTIDVFNALLGMAEQTEFIHLVANHQFPLEARSPEHTRTRSVVVLPSSVISLINGVYRRLCPSLGKEQWGESSPDLLSKYEQIEAVAADIARIPPVVLPLTELPPMTRPVNIKSMTDRFREMEGNPYRNTWSEGISVDLSLFVDRFEEMLEYKLSEPFSIRLNDFLAFMRKHPPSEPSRDADIERIAYDLSHIHLRMGYYGIGPLFSDGKRLVSLMISHQEFLDRFGVLFVKAVVSIEVPSALEAEFHEVTGLLALKEGTSPDWFQNAVSETTTPSFSL